MTLKVTVFSFESDTATGNCKCDPLKLTLRVDSDSVWTNVSTYQSEYSPVTVQKNIFYFQANVSYFKCFISLYTSIYIYHKFIISILLLY